MSMASNGQPLAVCWEHEELLFDIDKALCSLKINGEDCLVQVWLLTLFGGVSSLQTSRVPFAIRDNNGHLQSFRDASVKYNFLKGKVFSECTGFPGRVIFRGLAQCINNVQVYAKQLNPQKDDAVNCGVKGCLYLPMFQGQYPVGVIELATLVPKQSFAYEWGEIYTAFKAANLDVPVPTRPDNKIKGEWAIEQYFYKRKHEDAPNEFGVGESTIRKATRNAGYSEWPPVDRLKQEANPQAEGIVNPTNSAGGRVHEICNENRQNALAEILEILTVVCETHNLPLAQTWVPCRHRNVLAYGGGFKKSCSSFDGRCMGKVCMSTTDVAVYVVDAYMWGFQEACAEHHLQKGQGVAGKAFASRSSCFCENITQFCKTEYPLVHYASMFKLVGSFAICLRSTHTGDDDYILEFFLPPSVVDCMDQQIMLGSLMKTMKQHFRSLRVASGEEICEDGRSFEIIKASMNEKHDSDIESIRSSESRLSPPGLGPEALPNGVAMVHLDSLEQPQMVEYDASTGGEDIGGTGDVKTAFSFPETKVADKKSERKCGKAEKSISPEVLQQYFTGSLEDAAKSLGGSREESIGTPTSHGSWQGSPYLGIESPSHYHQTVSPSNEHLRIGGLPELESQQIKGQNPAAALSISDALVTTQPEEQFGGMLLEDAGSSHDLINLWPNQQCRGMLVRESTGPPNKKQRFATRPEMKTLSINAKYKDLISSFHPPLTLNLLTLREELGKRLKIETGTFHIKFLDDDQDWVLIACDADLQECVELSRLSGDNIIS